MPGGGGGGDATKPRLQARGRRQHQATSLPLDIVVEIAACTDPVTLVRCAATCWEVRHRVADDPAFRRRLRLRRTDRFVSSLLRGHFVGQESSYGLNQKRELYLVDTTAADATKVRKVTGSGFPSGPLASRDGLLLVRAAKELRVCDPATGRSQVLPSEPTFPGEDPRRYYHPFKYVLLPGDSEGGGAGAAVGRPFQLLIAKLELSQHRRHLQIQIFSSEHNTWGPYTEIRIPNLYGSRLLRDLGTALVVGGAMHWLCMTNSGSYVIKLHVRAAQVTVTELPESFPQDRCNTRHLLATTSPGGSPIVLVVDDEKILAWSQSKQTMKWKQQPQIVIDDDELCRYTLKMGGVRPVRVTEKVQLHWFAERSGLVLIEVRYGGFVWLDLRTMKMFEIEG
ncbi:hypothetical protein EJB05_10675, partial [Eragrostis curvula]